MIFCTCMYASNHFMSRNKAGSRSRSRHLGFETVSIDTYQRLVSVSSREKLSTSRYRLGLGRQTSRSRFGLGNLRLVPKTNFRPNCADHINKMLSYRRDRAAGCIIVLAKSGRLQGTGRQYFTDIIGLF